MNEESKNEVKIQELDTQNSLNKRIAGGVVRGGE